MKRLVLLFVALTLVSLPALANPKEPGRSQAASAKADGKAKKTKAEEEAAAAKSKSKKKGSKKSAPSRSR